MSKNELPDLIRIALENTADGLTTDELHEQLEGKLGYDVSGRTLEDRLRQMYEDGEIDRFRVEDGTRGQPPFRYTLNGTTEDATDEQSAEDTDTARAELVGRRGDFPFSGGDPENLPDGVYWDLVEHQLDSGALVEEVKEMAPALADEDPTELLIEMTDWAVEQLNEMGNDLSRLLTSGRTDALRGLRDEYEEFAQWCDGYFRGFWRLTAYDGPGPDLLRIPESSDILEAARDGEDPPRAAYEEAAVRERYEGRVFGDSVITRVKVQEEATDAVGTDATVARMTLPSRSRMGVDTEVEIFAGAAALEHEGRRFTDYDFNPTNLRDFRGRKAFRRGLIVSEAATPQLGQGELEKARYAAMDLRQYKETTRIIKGDFDPRPHGDTHGELSDYSGPDVMYLDGRVTPLVHQMAQFASNSIYGELVRQEIREFGQVADYASEDKWHTDAVFAGVVKSPSISWFAPLVFWYLETRYTDRDPHLKRIYRRPPVPDARLPHLLFVGLTEANGPPSNDEIYTTFRTLRRYYDHSIPEHDLPPQDSDDNLIDVNSRTDWMSYFEMVQERQEQMFDVDTIPLERFKNFRFAELCANVGTVMCYAGPPNLYQERLHERTRLPRMEVLANPPRDMPDEMRAALSIYAKNNYPDEDHADRFDEIDVDDIPTVVPGVIVRSDEVAKEVGDMLSTDIRDEIMSLVGVFRDEDSRSA